MVCGSKNGLQLGHGLLRELGDISLKRQLDLLQPPQPWDVTHKLLVQSLPHSIQCSETWAATASAS